MTQRSAVMVLAAWMALACAAVVALGTPATAVLTVLAVGLVAVTILFHSLLWGARIALVSLVVLVVAAAVPDVPPWTLNGDDARLVLGSLTGWRTPASDVAAAVALAGTAICAERVSVSLAWDAPTREPDQAREPSRWGALGTLVAVAVVISVSGAGGAPLRLLAGLPLVLVVPGHALVALVWRGHSLGRAERALLDLGLSLALAALSGLALNWTPWGLGGAQSTVLLGLLSLVAIAIVARRERGTDWPALAPPPRAEALLAGAAAVLVVAAVGLSAWSAARSTGPGFTQAWLVPAAGGRLDLGVQNDQASAETYRLDLSAGGRVVHEWPAVRLQPGQRWSATAALPAGTGGELTVYRGRQPAQVYRRLRVAPG
jgi:hypothetical protein